MFMKCVCLGNLCRTQGDFYVWRRGIVPRNLTHRSTASAPHRATSLVPHTPEGTEDSIQRAGVQSRGHNFYPADPGHFQDIYHFPSLLKPYAAILPDGGKAGHIGKIHAGFHLFGDK